MNDRSGLVEAEFYGEVPEFLSVAAVIALVWIERLLSLWRQNDILAAVRASGTFCELLRALRDDAVFNHFGHSSPLVGLSNRARHYCRSSFPSVISVKV